MEQTNLDLKAQANNYPSLQLSNRHLCDLELIINGGFNPLNGFMSKRDYSSVIEDMRLYDGSLWPMPITLDVDDKFISKISRFSKISLRDKEGFILAVLNIEDIWQPDLELEAQSIFQTNDTKHPGVHYLLNTSNKNYIGGKVEKIVYPHHHDYKNLRHTPDELKNIFKNKKWDKVIAFQTRNPLHKAHFELTMRAMEELNANLLVHPVVGMTKPGDVNHYTRTRCYSHIMKEYPKNSAFLSLLPLAMRMGGPKETLLHAIIRKNYGCTHIIVGRDHAGPGLNSNNEPFYGPYEAQEMLEKYQDELGIEMVPFKFMVFIPKSGKYKAIDDVSKDEEYKTLSGTELRQLLDKGKGIPEWFTFKSVARELELSNPPLTKRGLTIFFTGLSGSGKSTLANGLMTRLLEEGSRPVTLLDGDIVRTHLSSELGFSKEHRSINIKRIGYVASQITRNGGIAVCAPIAPYNEDRSYNRKLISAEGGYLEIFVNTPLEKCEERDSKGLYALAREGKIKEFTGISDPYEEPKNAEIVINSSDKSPEKLVKQIYEKIVDMGYIERAR
ncbi:MAG: adenylyltransferase [Flavobacteriales bacterium]|nr:adenylyltransferase [Flavobacteriales bacterium]